MAPDTGRRIHPIVKLDYPVRLSAYLIVGIGLAASFYQTGASPLTWAAMLVQCLGWAHLARAIAIRARDTKRAELGNLLGDAFIIGVWIAVIQFDPWLTTTFVIAVTVAFLSVGGIAFTLIAFAVMAVGAAVTTAVIGVQDLGRTSPLTMGLGIGSLLIYMSLFGLATNRQARHIVQNRRTIAQQAAEIAAFAEVTTAISASLDLGKVLDTIVRQAVSLTGADAGAIFQFDPAARSFVAVAAHNVTPEFVEHIRAMPIDPSLGILRRASEGQPFQIPRMDEATDYVYREPTLREGFHAMLAAPIPGGRNITRGITVFRRAPGAFADRTVELMVSLASQSRVALENARLFRESQEKGRELEIASRHKSQFLANMSHELRTPLNAILGYAELIQDGVYGDAPPRVAEVLDRLQLSGRHLLALINDVLDLSKIEAGQLTLSIGEYSMLEVVKTVQDAMESLATEKGLSLNVEAAPTLPRGTGDERRITQVLMNLVGNALKFTDAGSVKVRVDSDGESFRVAVTDTGPGIAEDQHKRIFEEFHQADGTSTRKKGGAGLGLAISRRIVEMHGGRIWVESAPGAGATFRFTVPLHVARPADESRPAPLSAPA